MAQADAEDAPVVKEEDEGQDDASAQIAQHDHGLRGNAQGGEVAVEQTQAAPQGTGQEDAHHRQVLVLGGGWGDSLLLLVHENVSFPAGAVSLWSLSPAVR